MYSKLLLLAIFLPAIVAAESLHYTVDLRNTSTDRVTVTIEMEMMGAEVVYYQMPAWAPGAYAMTNYGRFVENFKAFGHDGKEKPIERINDNRWHIKHGKDIKRITYEVTNSYKDSTSLYFALAHFDSAFVFANATALFGYVNDKKELDAEVTYLYPKSWQVETALPPLSEPKQLIDSSFAVSYHASNYDELADAPVMAGVGFQNSSFTLGKCKFDIVVASDKPFQMDSLTYYTKHIVEAQLDFFRDTPFVNYKFLINAPTYFRLPRKDQGALEHANSSAYLLVNVPWHYVRESFCHIISHEFFHAWNVKRIHSTKLGPFDYTKAVKTKELWMAEGVTDYYAHLLLARYGILPFSDFRNNIINFENAITTDGDRTPLSLEELSLAESEFNIDHAMQFYIRGPLTAFALDLMIRERTENRSSLDKVMLSLYNDAKKGTHYRDEELPGLLSKIAKTNISDFYAKYIAGTDSLSICDYLHMAGLACDIDTVVGESILSSFSEEMYVLDDDTLWVLQMKPTRERSSYTHGFTGGEILVSVNGIDALPDNYEKMRRSLSGNPITTISYLKDRKEKQLTRVREEVADIKVQPVGFEVLNGTTPLQKIIYESLFKK